MGVLGGVGDEQAPRASVMAKAVLHQVNCRRRFRDKTVTAIPSGHAGDGQGPGNVLNRRNDLVSVRQF